MRWKCVWAIIGEVSHRDGLQNAVLSHSDEIHGLVPSAARSTCDVLGVLGIDFHNITWVCARFTVLTAVPPPPVPVTGAGPGCCFFPSDSVHHVHHGTTLQPKRSGCKSHGLQ